MAYSKNTWVNDDTGGTAGASGGRLNAARLNHVEAGVESAATVADAAVAKSVVTTKGDLIAATGAAAVARVPVGAADTVPVSDSAETTGVAWRKVGNAMVAADAAIALTKLASSGQIGASGVTVGADSLTFGADVLLSRTAADRLHTPDTLTFSSPAARAYHNANQSIPDATDTVVALNSERFDTDTIHDLAVNNSRLTCKTAGKYLIMGNVFWAGSATGSRFLRVRLNGTTLIAEIRNSSSAGGDSQIAPTLYDLAVNDYVEMVVYQSSGGALDVLASGNFSPEFSMVKVG